MTTQTTSTITFHASSKPCAAGYLPMITVRAARGRMIGSRCPQGDTRRTFTTAEGARQFALDRARKAYLDLLAMGHDVVMGS